jgi:hypothetical protein
MAIDLAEYVSLYMGVYGKAATEADAILLKAGRSRAWYAQTQHQVDALARADARVAAEINARVTLANAGVARAMLPPPAIAQYVRARQCPRCGGYKRTAPRTAHIYCDYCGLLFDCDEDLARNRKGGIDPMSILRMLADGTRADMIRAREAGDDAAYLQAWRWPYAMDMVLCPENWSPRVGDPAYRSAMVEFCVRVTFIHNQDEARREASILRGEAREAAKLTPNDSTLTHFVQRCHEVLSIEEVSYERAGLFQLHPDALDRATYHRINMVLVVMDLLGAVPEERFDRLLQIAQIQTQKVTVDVVGIHQGSCGNCSKSVLVVAGARSIVCETCGHTLDCRYAYPCTNCGAHLIAYPGKESAQCAWCSTLMSFVAPH